MNERDNPFEILVVEQVLLPNEKCLFKDAHLPTSNIHVRIVRKQTNERVDKWLKGKGVVLIPACQGREVGGGGIG